MGFVMIDRVNLIFRGGNGGNGAASFHREKYVPRGGPDGGDGGGGGSVILVASLSVRTLKELGRRRIYQAERGQHGQGSGKHGRRGSDLILRVPVGTMVSKVNADGTTEAAGDLILDGQQLIGAKGGRGGWGNARFATSTHQAPRIAQRGQQGEEVRVMLDLKLLADVGLVGLPNAGKSTLLRAISAARPKVAGYPFTTLEPVLGVAESGWERFVVADIPGLIEGAHEGAGLGLDFLRHIERTTVIVHLVDGSRPEPWHDIETVNQELWEYGHGIENREQILVVNKTDIPEVQARRPELEARLAEFGTPLFISAAGGEGVGVLVERMAEAVTRHAQEAPAEAAAAAVAPVLRPRRETRAGQVRIVREDGAYRVEGERVVAFAEMMPLDDEEGRSELWRRLVRWGVAAALRRAGARPGDRIRLGRVEVEWQG